MTDPGEQDPCSTTEQEPPATTPRGKRRHRRAVDPGRGAEPVGHRPAWEDDPRAWGDSQDDSDQRILQEKPPHW